jgi:type II secretory pathway pseudopilin PulG
MLGPPLAATLVGLALTLTAFAAAAPTVSVNASEAAPPEIALIDAVPDWPLATNRAIATPLSVRASTGESVPRLVVKVTVVPFWTGVPLDSSTVARTSVVPFAWTMVLAVDSVIVDSRGASSGSLSHAAVRTAVQATTAHAQIFPDRPSPAMMECIRIGMSNYNSPMNLAAKASRGLPLRSAVAEAGYAMAALLVAMSVMAIMMSVAMPAWSHMIRRDKEAELVFRGTQYARAINLYQRKFANASPPSLDALIEQRLLRKKFRDPLSPNKDGEFQLLYLQNQSTLGGPGQTQGSRGSGSARGTGMSGSIGPSPSARGAIVGVASKNTGQSILIYKGKNHYNEWQFIGMEMSLQAGAGGAGGRGGSQRGGREGAGRDGGMSGPNSRGGVSGSGLGGRGLGDRGAPTTFVDRNGEVRTLPSRQGR